MWIKICGITRIEDALAAKHLGADALGFVLTKSPRKVDPARLRTWIFQLQGIEKVGVFTHEDPAYIVDIGEALGLDTVQLHTALTSEHNRVSERFRIIYAMHGREKIPNISCRIIIDQSKGSGTRGLWERFDFPFILAGGLTPNNVREAIAAALPVGVDVSSGVEASPGIKDAALMERFIKEALT
jgi:phosphoribosylanthranilate isomerase